MDRLAALRSSLTYANVMATIALFLALGGGAYAVSVPRNSVGPAQLKKAAVSARNIKNRAVTSVKVKDFSLAARDFQPGALPRAVAARTDDADPFPGPPGKVIRQTTVTTTATAKLYVLGTLRDPFLSCNGAGPCSAHWGVYVDDQPVPEAGLRLQANPDEGDGAVYHVLYGFTAADLPPGRHDLKLARTDSPNISSVGELGAQLGAFTLD